MDFCSDCAVIAVNHEEHWDAIGSTCGKNVPRHRRQVSKCAWPNFWPAVRINILGSANTRELCVAHHSVNQVQHLLRVRFLLVLVRSLCGRPGLPTTRLRK